MWTALPRARRDRAPERELHLLLLHSLWYSIIKFRIIYHTWQMYHIRYRDSISQYLNTLRVFYIVDLWITRRQVLLLNEYLNNNNYKLWISADIDNSSSSRYIHTSRSWFEWFYSQLCLVIVGIFTLSIRYIGVNPRSFIVSTHVFQIY
jgi:hypothetical protein